jgi:glycogen debranching enzyme
VSSRPPWTVAGERGAFLGRQDGTFEAWIWPVKILSQFKIAAQLANYPVPIDVNALSARISVTPAETAITYSHAAFTLIQHAFATRGTQDSPAPVAMYFEIRSIRPIEFTFSFTPEMLRQWPAPNFGRPDGEWVSGGDSGIYVLHTDNPAFSGIVAMPGTKPGILPPYQEHPQSYPLQLKLTFDPKRDTGKLFPLILGVLSATTSPKDQALAIENGMESSFKTTQEYYSDFFKTRTTIETPQPQLDEATRWAEVAVDQMQVRIGAEIGLVAGYYESAASARPGYAWFFGRDTLFTTYAINSYGDFSLTKAAIDFLLERQRADGKIMHEFSQSAGAIDWKSTPYFYAAADSVPLLVMAMWDYERASGDIDFLKQRWPAVRKAYQFERSHDSDGDGIYENTEGTGWVESWPPGMPHQEIYLAALDQQASEAMSNLASLVNEPDVARDAAATAGRIAKTIASEYFEPKENSYAFSRNADGTLDRTPSIYPAVAWWQNTGSLPNADAMLSHWASDDFSTDWGTRDIAASSPLYDPISYHQGSVWPLFTGWVSLAEYRSGHPASGYAHLMQNARLTWLQDLGSTTELLSGAFYAPLGRSSSHQMWSSAMILIPLLRGLFGIQPDAAQQRLTIQPHLPPEWEHAVVHNVHLGSLLLDVTYQRTGQHLDVTATTKTPAAVCLDTVPKSDPCKTSPETVHRERVALPPVEISIRDDEPREGDSTHALKVLAETHESHRAGFTLTAPGGSVHSIYVRDNVGGAHADGFRSGDKQLTVRFPEGSDFQKQTIWFSW